MRLLTLNAAVPESSSVSVIEPAVTEFESFDVVALKAARVLPISTKDTTMIATPTATSRESSNAAARCVVCTALPF